MTVPLSRSRTQCFGKNLAHYFTSPCCTEAVGIAHKLPGSLLRINDKQPHRQTDRLTKQRNPRCAGAQRVDYRKLKQIVLYSLLLRDNVARVLRPPYSVFSTDNHVYTIAGPTSFTYTSCLWYNIYIYL